MGKWYYWLLIAIVGLALYTYGVQRITSKLNDKAFDARQAAGVLERQQEDQKHAEAITRAEAAEQRASDLQSKIEEQKLVIAIAGDNAEKALQRIKDEDQKFTEEAAKVGRDVPAAERCRNICERLQRLRLITAAEAADCRADCQQ